ncbi:MAG: ABC transporter permease [Hydrogenibacillus schlegelii]|nr:ABC transporter permease [Hydrogenibacillus schlegelii]
MSAAFGQLLDITLVFSTALIFGAVGGLLSERAGVIALALEGYMTGGAFLAATSAYALERLGFGPASAYGALFLSMFAGALLALVHAAATVTYRADHVVSGVVVNFFAAGLSLFLVKLFFAGAGQTPTLREGMLSRVAIPGLADLPVVGPALFRQYPTTYLAALAVGGAYGLLFHTPLGLRLRAVGEHPEAAETLGVRVRRLRYGAVVASGAIAALGGATVALTTTGNFSHATIAGQGFIALAAMIFGRWHPFGAAAAALFFGMATGLKNVVQLSPWARAIPTEVIYMLPYALTLLVLAGFAFRSTPPAALGRTDEAR